MAAPKRIALILVWALSLIIVGTFAHAQKKSVPSDITPRVLFGSDIGFSVERRGSDHVEGTLVVRINGEWVAAEPVGRVKY
jgi:hypothetical protein